MTWKLRINRASILSMAALAATVFTACASNTQMTGVWADPAASGRTPAKDVLVVGINGDSTARRIHEDAVVAHLSARGIRSQPSYKLLPEIGAGPPLEVQSLLRNAGVDSVLVSRTTQVRTDIRVRPGHYYGPAGFYGMWGGVNSTAPDVYTVQKVEVEARLYAANDLALQGSGASTTTPSTSMQKTITEFATVLRSEYAEIQGNLRDSETA